MLLTIKLSTIFKKHCSCDHVMTMFNLASHSAYTFILGHMATSAHCVSFKEENL